MGKYRRLTPSERYQIEALMQSEISLRDMARSLNRSASTISRELKRNRGKKSGYHAKLAQVQSSERRKKIGPPKRIKAWLLDHVREKLTTLKLSPEQISADLKINKLSRVSDETIYKFIYEDYKAGGDLWTHLRRRRKRKRSRLSSRNLKKCGVRSNRLWIGERPKIVEERVRLGDFERDTVEGKKGGSLLLTIVDRTSRLTKIRWIERKNASLVHHATVEALSEYSPQTITNDNGCEFEMHDFTARDLGIKIYFSNPYHSWERGTNENTNGLIRQYFPKGSDPDPEKVAEVEAQLNNRPRKCLGYRTPLQVHQSLSRVLR